MSWQHIAAQKKSRQLDDVPEDWLQSTLPAADTSNVIDFLQESIALSDLDVEVTESSVARLLYSLATGKWSSVQVTTSFYKRAIIAHQLTNCLTEIFVDQALARAKVLDDHLAQTGKVIGPLHGLPISLKDQISIKGYVSWIGKVAEKNAVLVDILESLGAVPFVKTNVPQTLMWPETFNHVWGRTTNPHNRSLTCGGSSGGEGQLNPLRRSVRIPSAFCGLYGFRPSYNRLPLAGCVNSLEGEDTILAVLGPLSNSLDGLKTFYKAVLSKEPWQRDPMVIRKRWNEDEYRLADHGKGEKLCFAIMWDNGVVMPHPPIQRGLEMTKKALLAAGHEVIDWVPYKQDEIVSTILQIFNAGAGEDFKTETAPTGEPIITSMALEDDDFVFFPVNTGISTFESWQLQKKKRDLRQEHMKHWDDTVLRTGTGRPVDAIISPIAPFTATPHGHMKTVHYTLPLNLLVSSPLWLSMTPCTRISEPYQRQDYPAIVIPVSKVDQALDVKRPRTEFYNTEDQQIYERYTPETYADAPISVQVIGRTMEEEAIIAMSEVVDEALRVSNNCVEAVILPN
ncbi:amidase domain-containing protein [Favolaschia claudopus]|uniref:Amidase domain-containing protein n=1 Tax=Favolaschia claudopus TaxID=2862362 RepID=A0AAW0EHN4_9AGAR